MKRTAALVVGASAVALSSIVAVPGTAGAAIDTMTYWEDGNSRFEQTVSNDNPKVGETFTVTTSFQRKWADEYIYNVKELVGSCIESVPGTTTWAGKLVTSKVTTSEPGADESWMRVEAPSITAWKVTGLGSGWGAKVKLTTDFRVTNACKAGDVLSTTMHYGGSLGSGTYKEKGPVITIAEGTVEEPTEPGGSNGSLDIGSLFGSS
ncbi:hypothetical protein GM1_020_00430 [Gordonia malaquae NBRC 108250]|jgi:hypothetical protein|uniref:Uncharacterized protein n=2 Tax=Gordoniaceae TaxID=85026 RepID=M3VG72_GORML|nr:hypothetical protein GM1_020_00430 [Gordonia malaquae NBRC 108250]